MSSVALPVSGVARHRIPAWLVLAAVALWLMGLAWSRPLTLPDEGRYAGVAWEMLRSHSYLVPLMDGMPYFHKPPLYYWLAQMSFSVFGLSEWAARLPSLLIAWASIAGVYGFARRYRGERFAVCAVLVLSSMPFFYGGAQFANMDMPVAGMITLCVLAGADTIMRVAAGLPWRRMSLATALLAALAVLAKGLIGIVLPGAILFFWLLMRRDFHGFKALVWPPAIALFLLVALPWFVDMQLRYPGFFHYFFVYQHFERFALSGFNNVQPFWFYPPVLAGLTLPWSLWMGGTLRRGFWGAEDVDGLRRLMLIWLVVVVGFFSLPSSKLIGYILPAVPALAFLIAELVLPAWERGQRRRAQVCLGVAMALCVTGILIATFNPRGGSGPLGEQVRGEAGPYDTMVPCITSPSTWVSTRPRPNRCGWSTTGPTPKSPRATTGARNSTTPRFSSPRSASASWFRMPSSMSACAPRPRVRVIGSGGRPRTGTPMRPSGAKRRALSTGAARSGALMSTMRSGSGFVAESP